MTQTFLAPTFFAGLWLAAALAGLSASAAETEKPATVWRTVESLNYPTSTHQGYGLIVEDNSGSDDSPRLKIVQPNGQTRIVATAGGLDRLKDSLDGVSLQKANRLHSNYVYANTILQDRGDGPLLMVFGHAFASDPGQVLVIRLTPDGGSEDILSEEIFDVKTIIARHGSIDLVGWRSLSEVTGSCRSTYAPVAVFTLTSTPHGRFKYSLERSKTYNIQHEDGWAGPTAREDLIVNRCAKMGNRIQPEAKTP